jgi:hypothetical protein
MTKRKIIGLIAIGLILGIASVAPVFAAVIVNVGDYISITRSTNNSGWSGGAFHINDTVTESQWDTFCLERNEYFSPGSSYKVDSISLNAIEGGIKGGPADPISSQTAYLYFRYIQGTIAGLSGVGTGDQQKAIQYVIWNLENELALPGTENADVLAYISDYMSIANSATNGEYYGVRVVNPVDASGNRIQSQLVYVSEPGTLILMGSGLLGLVLFGRKKLCG